FRFCEALKISELKNDHEFADFLSHNVIDPSILKNLRDYIRFFGNDLTLDLLRGLLESLAPLYENMKKIAEGNLAGAHAIKLSGANYLIVPEHRTNWHKKTTEEKMKLLFE